MIAAHDDGGPAFPEAGLSGLPNEQFIQGRAGMSLRDYFAAKALTAIVERDAIALDGMAVNAPIAEDSARCAYLYADAMLKARAA